MATEKLVEAIARQIDRRDFLKKLGASTVGALPAFLGLSRPASAYNYACCHLCWPAGSNSCTTCAWCWSCLHEDGWWYACCDAIAAMTAVSTVTASMLSTRTIIGSEWRPADKHRQD